ncbi:MAG: tol-pal system protein YbgF [Nitrospirae bacterium]|nr:tol-pal system protein YbgF [Nitrospirota bacterium]
MRNKKYCSLFTVHCSLLFAFIFIAGCATSQDVDKIQYNLNELRNEVVKIKQKSQAIETQIPISDEKLLGKVQELADEQKAAGKALSDLMLKMQTLSTEVQVLMGRFEEAKYSSEKTAKDMTTGKESLLIQVKELELSLSDLKKRISALESENIALKKQKEEARKSENLKQEEIPAEPVKSEKPAKIPVKDAYADAYEIYSSGRIKEAREKFTAMLKDYPENEYSDNARFWIAESYYRSKEYRDAILAYEELLEKNPESNKVPEALLKEGLAFYAINDDKIGRTTLEKLIEKFPDSKEAKTAQKKIDEPQPIKKKKN